MMNTLIKKTNDFLHTLSLASKDEVLELRVALNEKRTDMQNSSLDRLLAHELTYMITRQIRKY